MKRFISLFVAFLLVISPLAGVSLPADAAETTVISEISLPQLPDQRQKAADQRRIQPAGEGGEGIIPFLRPSGRRRRLRRSVPAGEGLGQLHDPGHAAGVGEQGAELVVKF